MVQQYSVLCTRHRSNKALGSTNLKLEWLEHLHSEDTPSCLMITHSIESYWIPSQKKTKSKLQILRIRQHFKFWNKHYTRHTFWNCLIRCANIKWIRQILFKIQSGHDSVHRRTDGQGETSIPPFNFVEAGGINKLYKLVTTATILSINAYGTV